MKIKNGLMIISIVLISLLAISAASASENVSDAIATADFEESVAIEDVSDAVTIENNTGNSQILSLESENEPVTVNVEENEIIKEGTSNNRYDWTALYGKDGMGNNSVVIDLSGLFGKNNTNSSYLVLDFSNNTDKGSYLVLGLSSLLGENNTNDDSYLVVGLSGLLGGNNTNDNSYLVLYLPGLGINLAGNSTAILNLNNLLENKPSEGSTLLLDPTILGIGIDDPTPIPIDLDGLYEKDTILEVNLTEISKGNFTGLSSFLEDFDWDVVLGEKYGNISSVLNDLNWTALFEGNITSLADSLNLTSILGVNVTDIVSLFDSNMSTILDKLNLTGFNTSDIKTLLNLSTILEKLNLTGFNTSSIKSLLNLSTILEKLNLTGLNTSDIKSLLDFNLTKLLDGLNLTSLINNINWTSLINGNNTSTDAGNNKGFDWKSIIGGNNTGNNSIINKIINWITGNNTNNQTKAPEKVAEDSIKSSNLKTYYDTKTKFKVWVMSGDQPVKSGKITFIINNQKYTRDIVDGYTYLKLKLTPGKYYITSIYGNVSVVNKIVIKKSIITNNVNKKYKKSGKFFVKVLDSKGKPIYKQKVKIKFKGVTYILKTNKYGRVIFNLPKNLKIGKHFIKVTCKGLTITNKITVKR